MTLSAQGFESLVHRLARRQHPSAEVLQLRPPDVGADTLILQGCDMHGPLVYQAKHSQLRRLSTDDCRESLQQARRRRPAEVTFVFPFSFTESQRSRFRRELVAPNRRIKVRAWTLEDLRELLDRHRDVREAELDAPLRALLGGANVAEVLDQAHAGDELLAAAAIGPLEHLGLQTGFDAAVLLMRGGEHARAADAFEEVATQIDDPAYELVRDIVRRQATMAAHKAGERARAGRLRLALADNALRRGETDAEVHAGQLLWHGGTELRWRAEGMLARCNWPKFHDEGLPELAAAYDQAISEPNIEAVELCQWAVAYTDAALTLGAFGDALRVGVDARERIGSALPLVGLRMDLELDWLDAAGENGSAGPDAWAPVLVSEAMTNAATGAQVRQRQGVWHLRRGETDEAIRCFERAQTLWQDADEAQEQFAEAFLAVEVAEGLSGRWPSRDAMRRQTAGMLRGRRVTPTVIADRCEAEGLCEHLAGEPVRARERLTTALAFHRRAGNLRGVVALAYQLAHLHEAHDAHVDAVRWRVAAGHSDGACAAAADVSWSDLKPVVRMSGPLWERASSYAALLGSGGLISDADASELASALIEEALGPTSMQGPQPAARARAALAAIICALSDDALQRALDLLRIEARTQGAPTCAEATHGLMQAHEAGLSDEALVIAHLMLGPNRDYIRVTRAIASICNGSSEAREVVKRATTADDCPDALPLAAWMELPDEDEGLAAQCAARIDRALAAIAEADAQRKKQKGERVDVGVRHDDLGFMGRWASPAARRQLAQHFVDEFSRPDSDEPSRISALRALGYLSPTIGIETAQELLPKLTDAAAGNYAPPRLTEAGADIELDASGRELHPTGRLPAAALLAAARLAATAAIDRAELPSLALAALNSPHAVMRAAALGVYEELAEVPLPEGTERYLTDEAAPVRGAALRLLVTREPDALRSPAVMAMTSDDDVSVRLTVLKLARTHPSGKPTLAALTADAHCLLRRMATAADEADSV